MSISPELALAAAAAIGDKALQQQTKELLELKRQLAESRKVEITGSGGRPVYATGQFEDGKLFNSSRSWWDVDLTVCEGSDVILLTNLQGLEIRLGGIVYATLSEDEVQGHNIIILDNNSDGISAKGCRNVIIPIESGGGCRNATVQIDLRDMPEPPWKLLKSSISYNLTESDVNGWRRPLRLRQPLRW